MARFALPPSSLTQPFWDATGQKKLLLQWCKSCEAVVHYPREACPKCLGESLEWREASGKGDVYAFCVMQRPANPAMAGLLPYVVALVDLDEGARMMTNIVGCEPAAVRIGMPVRVTFEDLGDGRALPLFEPAS
jgi:hypothetical protein